MPTHGARSSRKCATRTPPAPAAATAPAAPNQTVTQFLPNRFALHIDTLTLLKRHWDSVIVGASHADGKWQANIASNQVSGHVSWLPGASQGIAGHAAGALRAAS